MIQTCHVQHYGVWVCHTFEKKWAERVWGGVMPFPHLVALEIRSTNEGEGHDFRDQFPARKLVFPVGAEHQA